jgi:hypothetical protein
MSDQVACEGGRGGKHHIDPPLPDHPQPARDGVSEPADLIIRKAEELGRGAAAPRPPTHFGSGRRASRASSDRRERAATEEPVSPPNHRGMPAPRASPNDRQSRIGSLDERLVQLD